MSRSPNKCVPVDEKDCGRRCKGSQVLGSQVVGDLGNGLHGDGDGGDVGDDGDGDGGDGSPHIGLQLLMIIMMGSCTFHHGNFPMVATATETAGFK